jgi:hypothetical protein
VLSVALAAAFALSLAASAQTPAPAPTGAKKALTIADYSRWRTITGQQMSADGKWVAFGLSLTNVPTAETKPVLTILNTETNQKVEITDASGASFSSDSLWIRLHGGSGRRRTRWTWRPRRWRRTSGSRRRRTAAIANTDAVSVSIAVSGADDEPCTTGGSRR